MTNILDDYALLSPLRHINSWLKLAVVFFGLLVGVSSTSPITPFFIAFCMSFATVVLGKTPLGLYFRLLLAPMGFAAVGVLIIAFFSGSGPEMLAFEFLGYPFSIRTDGFELALLVLSRSISGMCCLYFLALSTPMIELFAVLKASRIPESFIELSMLIYRYIFVFLDMALSIKYAQTVRLGYSSFRRSLNSMGMLGSTLFIRSWEQGDKLFLAMNSRCYDGKMTLFEVHRPVRTAELLLTSVYFVSALALFYFTKNISIV
ncbi:cobalt ECF transporter T component CbiQ [Methanosarcina hadiensis]|uniref:cobalt ECF transporter T component CbiQ n=1 Tax=Methanosarcina hadiensis TaxID=3078083 RepID=UPI003977C055